jgi:hypothetical protein
MPIIAWKLEQNNSKLGWLQQCESLEDPEATVFSVAEHPEAGAFHGTQVSTLQEARRLENAVREAYLAGKAAKHRELRDAFRAFLQL